MCIHTITHTHTHTHTGTVVAVASRGHMAISADAEGNIRLWDLRLLARAEQEVQEDGHGRGGEAEERDRGESEERDRGASEEGQLSEEPVAFAAEEEERAPKGAREGSGRGGQRGWRGAMRLPGASRLELAVERANVGVCVCCVCMYVYIRMYISIYI